MASDKAVDVTKMSHEDLQAEAGRLAAQRTTIRERQNAVQAELDFRSALEGMPAEARRVVELRLGGTAAPEGSA